MIEKTAKENKIPFRSMHIESKEQAQNAPTSVTTYALLRDGEYLTNEILSDKKFLEIIQGSSKFRAVRLLEKPSRKEASV